MSFTLNLVLWRLIVKPDSMLTRSDTLEAGPASLLSIFIEFLNTCPAVKGTRLQQYRVVGSELEVSLADRGTRWRLFLPSAAG